jgi:hypothetical protein
VFSRRQSLSGLRRTHHGCVDEVNEDQEGVFRVEDVRKLRLGRDDRNSDTTTHTKELAAVCRESKPALVTDGLHSVGKERLLRAR